jgi:hypothetical protein
VGAAIVGSDHIEAQLSLVDDHLASNSRTATPEAEPQERELYPHHQSLICLERGYHAGTEAAMP